ncbi:recombination protein O N-terminal domain-containing protein [Synechococcus sp. M16CYN]|uniref:DNA repair protein RecO n=1 Tax=Synechococcus sp. M16CYN TaxID=3103139 RepID=UPI003254EAF8
MAERQLKGLVLKVGPLGEYDRLLSLLSDAEGLTRLAVPNARRPKSSLAGAVPLTLLELQVSDKGGLARVRQLRVLRNFSRLGRCFETLASAQALCDLSLQLIANDPVEGLLSVVLLHLELLELNGEDIDLIIASTVQASIHLLALGGYALPMQSCCLSGSSLDAPLGQWDWRCSLLPEEGFAIHSQPGSAMELNSSELTLLQRLTRADLPRRKDGELIGPRRVWLRLLNVVELWVYTHLEHRSKALAMLRETLVTPE